jgi:hypothetical protein
LREIASGRIDSAPRTCGAALLDTRQPNVSPIPSIFTRAIG